MSQKALWGVGALSLAAVLYAAVTVSSDLAVLSNGVSELVTRVDQPEVYVMVENQDSKTFEWTDADCFARKVHTVRQPGEADDVFCARHDAAVAHDLQTYGVKSEEGEPGEFKPLSQLMWLQWYLKEHEDKRVESPFTKG